MRIALRQITTAVLVFVAGAIVVSALIGANRSGNLASDTRQVTLAASRAFVHGRAVYLHPADWLHPATAYVYPPFWAELCSPLLLLPGSVAAWLAVLSALASVLAALWIVGVRDPRVLAVATASEPVVLGTRLANSSALVCLLVALTFRYRSSFPLGVAIAVKLMAWPLLFWLAVVHGRRRAVVSGATAAGLIVVSWAIIGFQGLDFYPQIVRADSNNYYDATYGLSEIGVPHGYLLAAAATALAFALCWRRARAGDVDGAFAYGIAATLTAAPIVWDFYFTLMLLALALRRPTLSAAWFVPLLLSAAPRNHFPTTVFDKALGWAVVGGLLVWLGSGAPSPSLRRRRTTYAPV